MSPRPSRSNGLSLIELLIASALTALLWTALQQVVMLALPSRQWLQSQQELQYQLDFAMERVIRIARNSRSTSLNPNSLGNSGAWFAPVYFCTTPQGELRETTSTDTTCSRGDVVATGVASFAIDDRPATTGLDSDALRITLSLKDAGGGVRSVQQDVRRMEAP